jgi:hypothetical protein
MRNIGARATTGWSGSRADFSNSSRKGAQEKERQRDNERTLRVNRVARDSADGVPEDMEAVAVRAQSQSTSRAMFKR